MPAWVITAGHAVGKALVGMLAQLAAEQFVRELVVYLLEVLVKKTETKVDDELLKKAKEAWEIED